MAKEIEEKIFFYSKSAPHGSGTCPLTRTAPTGEVENSLINHFFSDFLANLRINVYLCSRILLKKVLL